MSAGHGTGRGKLALTMATAIVAAAAVVVALPVTGGQAAAGVLRTGAAGAGPVGTGAAATAGTISTLAGGVGGPGTATSVGLQPCGVSGGAGHLYVADLDAIRSIVPGTGELTTIAGTGIAHGPLGDNGPGASATVSGTCSAVTDAAGNVVIAASGQNRVRVVAARSGTFYGQAMTAGNVYTVAGDGATGFAGDGGPATMARLAMPEGVAVDHAGNLVIADAENHRIRVVAAGSGTFYGQAMTAGHIYSVAGDGTNGSAGDGGPATAAELGDVEAVTVDGAGNLAIADPVNDRVRLVAERSGTFYGQAMTAGDIYTAAGDGKNGFSGDGGPATAAELLFPEGVAADGAGNLVIADTENHRIRVVAGSAGTFYHRAMTAGHIYTVAGSGQFGYAGDGGPATSAALSEVRGVAVDGSGNVLIADTTNFRVRVVAARTGTSYGQAMTAGDIYTVAGTGQDLFSGDGGPATAAELFAPEGTVAVPAGIPGAGSLLIADTMNNRIRVAAARSGTFYGQQMTAGDLYTVAGDGAFHFSGDGGPATKAALDEPGSVATDAAGNMVITDTRNRRIRVVAERSGTFYGQAMTAGDIYTVAGNGGSGFSGDGGPATRAKLDLPGGVAVDHTGNLVIADTVNDRIRVVAAGSGTFYGQAMTAGHIYTIAGIGRAGFSGDGGPATKAGLFDAASVTPDAAGNLVIADTGNERVRVVAAGSGTFYGQAMTAGDIYSVAGTGTGGFSGDGGPATKAALDTPHGVALDGAGNLVIADMQNGRVRVVAERSGTFYGQAMTAGDIYTVAGTAHRGFSGDGGPASSAQLFGPASVAFDGASLLIADAGDSRVRMISG